MTDLPGIAAELYALDLDAFTRTRTARAAETRAVDRPLADAVAALPKPSRAAWFVNQLTRTEPAAIADAVALGAELRRAQDALDAAALRELGKERRARIVSLLDLTRALAADRGSVLGATIATDVEATLLAALLDADAAAAVATGLLVRSLVSLGGEPVDLDGAVAVPEAIGLPPAAGPAAPPSSSRAGRTLSVPAADAAAERHRRLAADVAAARDEQRDAVEGVADAARRLDDAVAAHRDAVHDRDALQEALSLAEERVLALERERRSVIRDQDRAVRRRDSADRRLARAEERAG